jgi:hypothetical protein
MGKKRKGKAMPGFQMNGFSLSQRDRSLQVVLNRRYNTETAWHLRLPAQLKVS